MRTAGYTVAETDPFAEPSPVQFAGRPLSPYVGRMRLLWATMRTTVLEHFPAPPAVRLEKAVYLQQVEDVYRADAYHSLSIEGYQVSDALIERVRSGAWKPDRDESDRQNRNALAARGYWQAFQRVKAAVEQVLDGGNAGEIADRVHPETIWVLDAVHGRSPQQLAAAIELLLNHQQLSIQESDVVLRALDHFRARPGLGFSDCLVLEIARKAGHLPLGTFDRPAVEAGGNARDCSGLAFLHPQVFMPSSVYAGQNRNTPVAIMTRPSSPRKRALPSSTKSSDSRTIPTTMRRMRSVPPTFAVMIQFSR